MISSAVASSSGPQRDGELGRQVVPGPRHRHLWSKATRFWRSRRRNAAHNRRYLRVACRFHVSRPQASATSSPSSCPSPPSSPRSSCCGTAPWAGPTSRSCSASTSCHRARDHGRLPPAAHPPRLRDLPRPARRAGRAGLDGDPGRGDHLGGRPPQAPRLHRRGGRSALPATATAAACSARSPAWPTPISAGCSSGHGRAEQERYAKDLLAEPGLRFVERTFFGWAAFGLVLPFALGWLITGTLRPAR